MEAQKNIRLKILIALFLMLLLLPNIVMIFNLENTINNEKREFKNRPTFNSKTPLTSIRAFKNYYEENFGLKTSFVNTYIAFKNSFSGNSPIPNRVVKGNDGWYFLGNSFNESLNNSFGNAPFSTQELNNITEKINGMKTYLNSKNIEFFLVIAPNKNSIYEEKLPYSLSKQQTKIDQLKAHLKSKLNFDLIDLRPTLITHKAKGLLFLKTDTHWNEYGAFLGYQKTMEEINMHFDIEPAKLSDFNQTNHWKQGDISVMVNNMDLEETIKFSPKDNIIKAAPANNTNYEHYINPQKELKVIIIHDSFANALKNYLNFSFGESIYIKGSLLDKTSIEKEKPDLVIFEIVERNIINLAH